MKYPTKQAKDYFKNIGDNMNKIKLTAIILLIIIIFSSGVAIAKWVYTKEPSVSNVKQIDGNIMGDMELIRFHDDTANATCWFDAEGGLAVPYDVTCLPDYMLNRPKDYNPMR